MKRFIIKPLGLIFVVLLCLNSCGNEAKVKPVSSNKTSPVPSTKKEILKDTKSDSLILAKADEQKIGEKKSENIEEKESYNPPHIPVFKEEKNKSKDASKDKESKSKASSTSKKANSGPNNKTKSAEVAKQKVIKEVASAKNTEIVWRRNFYSFGDITQGDTVYFKFEFTNIGEAPLVIESATPSCECTFPSYSFIPIEPNSKGEINGFYVSDTKKGSQNAMIQVVTNTDPSIHKLYIDGNVLLSEDKSDKDDKGND